ncbi:MAG TPA: hypothetical protein DEA96_02855 [Leptospiraceae bacterium]|nr:hypothetical protein [Spirochaetaceae bacterium]HBS03877.1 hypothetical protein [Leptospiraceae bacterium]
MKLKVFSFRSAVGPGGQGPKALLQGLKAHESFPEVGFPAQRTGKVGAVALRALLLLSLLTSGLYCSSVDAFWYASPDFYFRGQQDDHVAAKLNAHGINHILWAYSGTYTVMRGPCLIPMWDAEPPILNQQYLILNWRIEASPEYFPLEIHRNDLQLMTADGNFAGKYVYACDVSDDSVQGKDDYNDGDTNTITVTGPTCLSVRYYDLYFGAVDEFYITPRVSRDGKPVDTPTVRFQFKRDYGYDPYEFPFMFMPVR